MHKGLDLYINKINIPGLELEKRMKLKEVPQKYMPDKAIIDKEIVNYIQIYRDIKEKVNKVHKLESY